MALRSDIFYRYKVGRYVFYIVGLCDLLVTTVDRHGGRKEGKVRIMFSLTTQVNISCNLFNHGLTLLKIYGIISVVQI